MSEVDNAQTSFFHQAMPFTKVLGVEVITATKEEVRARVAWSPDRCTSGGALHGGVVMALADSTGATCAYLNLPEGSGGTTTIESKTNFLRGVREGHIESVSRPLHAGRTVMVIETDVMDASGKRVARVTQTQAVLSG